MSWKNHVKMMLVLLPLAMYSCGGGGGDGNGSGSQDTSGEHSVTVSWNSNPETRVNTAGGGYLVYYSTAPGFSPNDSSVNVKDVPCTAGPTAPTSTSISLPAGTWYFKVVAYGNMNGEIHSSPSTEVSITGP